jgi:uncharacterized membrane protein
MGDLKTTIDSRAKHQFDRLVFFSDAVFAIAITVLVLDLHAPIGPHGELQLGKEIPSIVGFVLSFYVIGIYWQAHHTLFGRLEREDRLLRSTNLIFLLTIVFLPFPTSVIARFPDSATTTIFYAASAAAVGLTQVALILAARRPGIMRAEDLRISTAGLLARPLAASLVFLASIPVAFVSGRAAWMWILIIPGRALMGRIAEHMDRRRAALEPQIDHGRRRG